LNLGFVQAGEVRAIFTEQRPAAVRAALGHDRDTRDAERFHVAMNRSFGDFQPFRKRPRRELPVRLQQQDYR